MEAQATTPPREPFREPFSSQGARNQADPAELYLCGQPGKVELTDAGSSPGQLQLARKQSLDDRSTSLQIAFRFQNGETAVLASTRGHCFRAQNMPEQCALRHTFYEEEVLPFKSPKGNIKKIALCNSYIFQNLHKDLSRPHIFLPCRLTHKHAQLGLFKYLAVYWELLKNECLGDPQL